MIPIFTDPKVLAWPGHQKARPKDVAQYYPLQEMLTTRFDCDAHFSQYSVPILDRRLDSHALGHEALPDGIPLALLVFDIDQEEAHKNKTEASAEWRTGERTKVEKLFAEAGQGYYYETKKGYRLVFRQELVIKDDEEKERWREEYFRACCLLASRYLIVCDPACSDWTRLFRCPHATRDEGQTPEERPTLGDPAHVARWSPVEQLSDEECLRIADQQNPTRDKHHGWWKVQRAFLPAPKRQLHLVDAPASSATTATMASTPTTESPTSARPQPETSHATMEKTGSVITIHRPYGLAALRRESEALKKVDKQKRTKALEGASLRLFGLVKAGALEKPEVEKTLRECCAINGWTRDYSQGEFVRQVENWWEMAEARDLSQVGLSTQAGAVELHRGPKGAATGGVENPLRILRGDPTWKDAFALDTFSSRITCQRYLEESPTGPGDELDDDDVTRFRSYCTRAYDIVASEGDSKRCFYTVAKESRYSSAERWMNELPAWDGTHRLDTWLCVYLLAPDTEFTRLVGPWWLMQGVARIYRPGEQCDGTLVLEGLTQGEGKSSLAYALVPDDDWACDQPLDPMKPKEAGEILQGKLIVELAELTALKRADIESIKGFLTQRADDYRPPWAMSASKHPRQCIFLGTTNKERYLRDDKNRRFWPVRVEDIDRKAVRRDRDQLWAEALHRYRSGEKWFPETAEQKAILHQETESRIISDDATREVIERYLRDGERKRSAVCVSEVMEEALQIPPSRFDQRSFLRVSSLLKELGWIHDPSQTRYRGKITRLYHAPEGWELFDPTEM